MNRRGGVLALMAVSITALMGLLAIAADVGLVYTARSEAQRAADAAALAGMSALLENPNDLERVRRIAAEFASANRVRGEQVQVEEDDITIVMSPDTLLVVGVHRSAERGNPVATMFAQIIGISHVDISAYATAGYGRSGAATCLKPFLVPDLWDDTNGNGRWDPGEAYDPMTTGYGSSLRTDVPNDVGRAVTIYPGGSGSPTPSFYYLWRMPASAGANDIRQNVASPECSQQVIASGHMQGIEPGGKKGPVNQGITDLVAQDPGAYWDPTTQTIRGSVYGDAWGASPRVVRIAAFDPTVPVPTGAHDVSVTNFVTLFIEGRSGDVVTGRILPPVGAPVPCTGSGCTGARYARLLR
jgi:hypothetical protein